MLGLICAANLGPARAERPTDARAFTNLLFYESAERSCIGRKAPDVLACIRAAIGPNLTKNAMEARDPNVDEEKRATVPRRLAGPNLIASTLNDYDLGLQFRVANCRVVADLTDQQRHNLAKVADPDFADRQRLRNARNYQRLEEEQAGPTAMKEAMQPFELDLEEVEGKFVLSVVNLSTRPPPDPRFPSRCLSRIRTAYETGDLIRVLDDRCTAGGALQSGAGAAVPAPQRTSALDRLKGKLAKLREGEAGKPEVAESEPKPKAMPSTGADPCLTAGAQAESRNSATAGTAANAVGLASIRDEGALVPRPAGQNPFDSVRNGPVAAARSPAVSADPPATVPVDRLPGFPVAPAGAVVADLTRPGSPDDLELRELRSLVAALTSADGMAMSQRPKDQAAAYKPLADFLARPRTAARRAEIIGRAVIGLKAVGLTGPDGKPKSWGEVYHILGARTVLTAPVTLPLLQTLLGPEPPSAAPDSFAPQSKGLPNPVDMLYRTAIVLYDQTSASYVPHVRYGTFFDLFMSDLAYLGAGGQPEPAAVGPREPGRQFLRAVGYDEEPSDASGVNIGLRKGVYRPKGGPPVVLYDTGRIKVQLASAPR